MARTKIVCTLGPATADPDMIRLLVEAGMRVARINCSHGDHAQHAELFHNVRNVSKETGIAVATLFDLSGPKIRTGDLPEPVLLEVGKEFTLTTRVDLQPGDVPLGFTELPEVAYPGLRILFDDGALQAEVVSETETDVVCRTLVGGLLKSHKGINVPGVTLPIPAVTEKDIADLRHALQLGADWIAMSFVRRADDLAVIKQIMAEEGVVRPVIAKIEMAEAVEHLEEIIDAYDAVMVARGDLGVEMPLEEIPKLQKEIIRLANRKGKPVITATQMLDSMIRNPRPTRAEVTDVANAILDGTDAVMLSGETSVGEYPLEAVRTMVAVANSAETLIPENAVPIAQAPHYNTPTGALAASAVQIADHLQARAIFAVTVHGHTATLVAKSRPQQPIFAITASLATYTQLPLLWGVTPYLVQKSQNTDEMVDRAVRIGCRTDLVTDGDIIVIVAVGSHPMGVVTRATDMLRVARIQQKCLGITGAYGE